MDMLHVWVLVLFGLVLGFVTGYGYGHRSGCAEAKDRLTRRVVQRPFRG